MGNEGKMAKSKESVEEKKTGKKTGSGKKVSEPKKASGAKKAADLKKTSGVKKVSEPKKASGTKKVSEPKKTSGAKKVSEPKKSAETKKAVSAKNTSVKNTVSKQSKRKTKLDSQIEQSNLEMTELWKPIQEETDSRQVSEQKSKKVNKKLFAVVGLIVIALIIFIILLVKGCGSSSDSTAKERQNTIHLVKKYMDKEQYDPAMELLNKLLIQNADDDEVNQLLDKLIELKAAKDKKNAGSVTVVNQGAAGGSYDINIDTSAFQETFEAMSRELNAANEANAKNQEQLNRILEAQRQEEKERQAKNQALEQQRKAEEAQRKAEEDALAKQNKKVQEEIHKINDLIQQGNSNLQTGKSEEALKKYNEAVARLPISQGEPKFSGSKYAEIASNLYEAAERDKNPESKNVLMNNAVKYAQKAVEKDPSNAKAHFILAMNAEKSKDGLTAEKELELAVKNDPNNYLYYYYLGRRQQINKKYSEARISYTSSNKLNPSSTENEREIHASSYFNLGLTCNRLSLSQDALLAFRKAYGINPQHAKAYLEEARLLRKGFNDLEKAIAAYNKVLNIEPDNMFALRECGSCYAETENYGKAELYFKRVVAKLGTNPDPMTYFNLSTVLYNQSKVSEALKYAKEAYNTKDVLRTAGEKAVVVYQYALCSEKSGDSSSAISLYKEVLSLNPSHTKAKINLGIMFMEMNPPDVETALTFLTSAYQEEKSNFEVNNNLGNAYLLKKDYGNAVNYYLNASRIKPKDIEVKVNLAKAYTEAGEFTNAKTVYIEVINQNPNSYDSYIDLAKVCIALKDEISAEGYLIALQNKKPEYRAAEVKTLLDTVRPKN